MKGGLKSNSTVRAIPPEGAIPPSLRRRESAALSAKWGGQKRGGLGARPRGPRARQFQIKTWTFQEKPSFKRLRGKLRVGRLHQPEVEVHDEARQLVVIADLPGVKLEDLDIHVHGDVVAIEATRKDDSGQVHRYARELMLPVEVHDTPIDVTLENGLLEVRLKATTRAARGATGNVAEPAEDDCNPKGTTTQDGGDKW